MTAAAVARDRAPAAPELEFLDPEKLGAEWFAPVNWESMPPRPRLSLSDWADRYRVLSRKGSAEPGQWITDRAPYQRGIQDAISDPLIPRVVFVKASQVGATEILTNAVGRAIHMDPGPILVVQPNLELARAWSTDRLKPMLRESPALAGRVTESDRRHSGDTILHKDFWGGHLTIVGANSAAGLASRPIRDLYLDEVDRYPPSAGREGDPVNLAVARTRTFPNRKIVLASTPTIKGASRIEVEWEHSDQRRYFVACPECGHKQVLIWGNLKWQAGAVETAAYACAGCGVLLPEDQKGRLLARGEWVPTYPGRRTVGFHINALYSPWAAWSDLAEMWEQAQGDATRTQTFVNLALGEVYEDTGSTMTPAAMSAREEVYPAEVPAGVVCLTAAVDVQEDRLELLVVGWGHGEESWRIRFETIQGDPTLGTGATGSPWAALDAIWRGTFRGVDREFRIAALAIDSGHHTTAVYDFVRPRWAAGVYAIKGASVSGRPLVPRKASRRGKPPIPVYVIGVDAGKDQVAARLKTRLPGPGYMHTYKGIAPEYYDQITAERAVRRLVAGRWSRKWVAIAGRRNEALDLEVYALAALALAPGLRTKLAKAAPAPDLAGSLPPPDEPPPPPVPPGPGPRMAPKGPRRPRPAGWLKGWRR